MKKQHLTMLLAGALAMALFAGCGNKTEGEVSPTPAVTESPAPTETLAPTQEPVAEPTTALQETEPPVVTEDYQETKVTLGRYKGLTLYEVESSVIAQELVEMMEEYKELALVFRGAENGDTVNIDYVGKKDGVAFEGGTDEGFNLELGSNTFIDGFEEGLIGAVAGEVRELELTFPANYHSADLAGQTVVFTVTVNNVLEPVTPSLTDEFVQENLGYNTMAEYVAVLYAARNKESFYEQITTALMETSTVENYPSKLIEQEKQSLIEYYTSYAEMYSAYLGMDMETTLASMFGFESLEVLDNYAEEYAFNVVKNMLVLSEIAVQEGLTISTEEYQNRALVYATAYGYEDVASFEADFGKEAVMEAITADYVMDYVISQSTVVKAEDNKESEQ